jgi:hypothetical protein
MVRSANDALTFARYQSKAQLKSNRFNATLKFLPEPDPPKRLQTVLLTVLVATVRYRHEDKLRNHKDSARHY